MRKKNELTEMLEEEKPVETTLNSEQAETPVTLEQIAEAIQSDDEPKKRGRRKGQGRKSNAEKQAETNEAHLRDILKVSFGYALMGFSSAIAQIFKADKWQITDEAEANYLGGSVIDYLDARFPEWEKASPELNLCMAWSSYFVKRLTTKTVVVENVPIEKYSL